MRFYGKYKQQGYATRKRCERKLRDMADKFKLSDASVGFVNANEDGTFSPVIFVSQADHSVALALAANGVYAVG